MIFHKVSLLTKGDTIWRVGAFSYILQCPQKPWRPLSFVTSVASLMSSERRKFDEVVLVFSGKGGSLSFSPHQSVQAYMADNFFVFFQQPFFWRAKFSRSFLAWLQTQRWQGAAPIDLKFQAWMKSDPCALRTTPPFEKLESHVHIGRVLCARHVCVNRCFQPLSPLCFKTQVVCPACSTSHSYVTPQLCEAWGGVVEQVLPGPRSHRTTCVYQNACVTSTLQELLMNPGLWNFWCLRTRLERHQVSQTWWVWQAKSHQTFASFLSDEKNTRWCGIVRDENIWI